MSDSTSSRPPLDDPQSWLEANDRVVVHVARSLARRRGLPEAASRAFETLVRQHLTEDDYRVLRGYGGAASIRAYIAVVASRALLGGRSDIAEVRQPDRRPEPVRGGAAPV